MFLDVSNFYGMVIDVLWKVIILIVYATHSEKLLS